MLKIYPAIFSPENEGYCVFFHDLEGCQTEGDTLEEAMLMAEEALGLYLVSLEERGLEIPNPSNPKSISVSGDDFVSFVTCNIEKYRRNKSVKKTLSIPQWLNEQAELKHINFSSVLQKALKEELHITNS